MRIATWTLTTAVALPALAAAQAPVIDAQAGCIVARRSPVFTARIDPADQVARARVYFRAQGHPQWYFVEMKARDGVFRGTLPRPGKGTERIEYYIEATGASAATSRTADQASDVVGSPAECSRVPLVASVTGEPTPVSVGGPPGAPLVPAGFEANGVVAAGAAGAAVAATAAGAGGGGISTAALVVGGVVVAGGAAAAVTLGGDNGDGNGGDNGDGSCGTVSITARTATSLTVAWSGGNPTDGKYIVDTGRVAAGSDCSALAHELPFVIVQGTSVVVTGLSPATTYNVHVHPAGTPCSTCDTGYNLTDTVGSAAAATLGQ